MAVEAGLLLNEARELMADAVKLRRTLHRRPELGLRLPETTRATRDALASLDIPIWESSSTSGFVATIQGARPGPTVLLRGDMDALPMSEDVDLPFKSEFSDRMHACGHDAHTAMLVAAAHLLHRHREQLHGSVKLMFQPGEEGYYGAKHMLSDGMLEQPPSPKAAFALHIAPNYPSGVIASRGGPILASADRITIRLVGRGGHASMPHLACDPIPAACEIILAVQSFVTRRVDVFDPIVLSISEISSGSSHNVLPESARLTGTLRSMSEVARERGLMAVERIASHIAAAHELKAEIELERGYPPTINDARIAGLVRDVAIDLLGERGFEPVPYPRMAAEDFSYVLEKLPGCWALLGAAPEDTDPQTAPGCHSNRMVMDENAMLNGIALHAAVAFRLLSELA